MILYDSIIRNTLAALPEGASRYPYDTKRIWKNRRESELIMLRDTAYELGGSNHPSVNYTCVTTSGLIPADETVVVGPDLPDIREDCAFAKIVLLETEDLGEAENEEKAYDAIRNLEFVRYHVFPAGYMGRVSSETNREQVRVSKKVISAGIRFAYVGNTYIRQYRSVSGVKKVCVIFITDEALVRALTPNAGKVDAITKTLTHILDGLPTDCGHCSLKPVCDEVEGMRELHLGKKKKD